MQNLYKLVGNKAGSHVELSCFSEDVEAVEQLVVFELLVPVAAKVPALRQRVEVAKLLVQAASITSTVPGTALARLQVSNTAMRAGWCITATLAASAPSRRSSLY